MHPCFCGLGAGGEGYKTSTKLTDPDKYRKKWKRVKWGVTDGSSDAILHGLLRGRLVKEVIFVSKLIWGLSAYVKPGKARTRKAHS